MWHFLQQRRVFLCVLVNELTQLLTDSFGENVYYLYTAHCSICNLNTGSFQTEVANSMMHYFLGEKDGKSSFDRGLISFYLPSSSGRSIIFYYTIDILIKTPWPDSTKVWIYYRVQRFVLNAWTKKTPQFS